MLAVFALITVAIAVAVYYEQVGSEWLIAWVFVEAGIASIWRRSFHRALHAIDTPEHDLGLLAGLLARFESQRFDSPRMTTLQQALLTDGVAPSKRIAQLGHWCPARLDPQPAVRRDAYVLLLRRSWRSRSSPAGVRAGRRRMAAGGRRNRS
jgi:hypothetical protein